jgi:dTMP kinase
MQGCFITFEGGEGTGKSTQIRLLADYLSAKNIDVLLTKEPGGTEIGQELRKMLLVGDKDKFDATAEALLYYADRRIHLRQKILPALEKGRWVISDRFADSTMAYQYYGYDKKVPKHVLENLYEITVENLHPDLTIILDLNPEIGLARSIAKNSTMAVQEIRYESRGIEFHNRMREGFLEIAKTNNRYVVLDADNTIEELHKNIVKVVEERFFNI